MANKIVHERETTFFKAEAVTGFDSVSQRLLLKLYCGSGRVFRDTGILAQDLKGYGIFL